MEEKTNTDRILVAKHEGNRQFLIPHRNEIIMLKCVLKEIGLV
jgi:hypothetical protein